MNKCKDFLIALIISLFFISNVQSSDFNLNELKAKFPFLPEIPSEFTNQNISIDDIKKILKDKCFNVTHSDEAYEELESNAPEFFQCITSHINVTAIEAEMEEAKPKGELDAVFNKYCKKRPDVMNCVKNFTAKVEVCLTDEEKQNFDMLMRIIDSLLNFVCYKGGDQIALFIAEKGPECLQKSAEPISECVNSTYSHVAPNNTNVDVNNIGAVVIPQFVMGPKECKDMEKLENCIVKVLEKCEEITPANIIESMFRFIKNETKCPVAMLQKSSELKLSPNFTFIGIFFLVNSVLLYFK